MIKSFFEYIKNPVQTEITELFTFKIYIKLIVLCNLLGLAFTVLPFIVNSFELLPTNQKPKIDSLLIFVIVVILGPLLEETLFRLNLKITKLNMTAFLAVLLILITKVCFFSGMRLYFYLSSIPLFFLVYYTISLFNFPLEGIATFLESKFKYIFHLSAIIFGMIHLSNYETIYWWMIIIIPIITAPYISMGYIFGYVRMKYGFLYGLLMHSTINFIFAFMVMPKHWL